jgi:opacity protein-like surface antigen
MKKLATLIVGVFALMIISVAAKAQSNTDFFVGKWDILVKGTPQGDVNMKVSFEKKDGKLVGTMVNPDTQKEEPFNKLDTTEKGIIVYFSAQGYDVDMSLEKQDDDHVIGSVMNMLEVTGVRVKKEVTTLTVVAE